MRVRVRIVNEESNASKELIVLVNGGAESYEPVVAITPSDARDIGLEMDDSELIEVELASGRTYALISRGRVRVELLDEGGGRIASTYACIAVDENLTEPLITDATIDELGIMVLSFRRGLWRHVSDPPTVIRGSAAR